MIDLDGRLTFPAVMDIIKGISLSKLWALRETKDIPRIGVATGLGNEGRNVYREEVGPRLAWCKKRDAGRERSKEENIHNTEQTIFNVIICHIIFSHNVLAKVYFLSDSCQQAQSHLLK